MELSLREEFKAPPAKVFAALTDIAAAEKWMPNLVRIEVLTEGAFGVGTKWRETRTMFGREASEIFEVTAFTPARESSSTLTASSAQASAASTVSSTNSKEVTAEPS